MGNLGSRVPSDLRLDPIEGHHSLDPAEVCGRRVKLQRVCLDEPPERVGPLGYDARPVFAGEPNHRPAVVALPPDDEISAREGTSDMQMTQAKSPNLLA